MELVQSIKNRLAHRKGTYSANLAELIGLCVNQTNLAEILDSIEKGYKPNKKVMDLPEQSTINYFNKILLEETERQFTHNERPFIELLMNAIDAKPENTEKNKEYVVSMEATNKEIKISDQGTGMDLETLLTTLLIPFNSEKDSLEDLGRFGVGFFSALRYCIEDSNRTIVIHTGDGKKGYEMEIGASGDISTLETKIKKMKHPVQGTEVSISRKESNSNDKLFSYSFLNDFEEYLLENFDFFDSSRAKINLNFRGRQYSINNRESIQETPPLLRVDLPVLLETGEENIEQKIRLKVDLGKENGTIRYYSQGIFIKEEPGFEGHSVKIDFPSAVKVVEGRDELKCDDNFYKVIGAVQNYLISLLEERTFWELPVYEKNYKQIMELVPTIMDVAEQDEDDYANFAERLINTFIKKYEKHPVILYSAEKNQIFSEKDLMELTSFFPSKERKELFITNNPHAYEFYTEHGMKSFYEFMQENTNVVYESKNLAELKKQAKEMGLNISVLRDIAPKNKRIIYKVVSLENNEFGYYPFCSTISPGHEQMDIYINLNHPRLKTKSGYLQRYASRLQWLECFTTSGKSIEDKILSGVHTDD